jgi:hypothetical protein
LLKLWRHTAAKLQRHRPPPEGQPTRPHPSTQPTSRLPGEASPNPGPAGCCAIGQTFPQHAGKTSTLIRRGTTEGPRRVVAALVVDARSGGAAMGMRDVRVFRVLAWSAPCGRGAADLRAVRRPGSGPRNPDRAAPELPRARPPTGVVVAGRVQARARPCRHHGSSRSEPVGTWSFRRRQSLRPSGSAPRPVRWSPSPADRAPCTDHGGSPPAGAGSP